MATLLIAGRKDIANNLLPLYNDWHTKAVKQGWDSPEALESEQILWAEVKRYPNVGLPIKMTAAVGRWVAKQLHMQWLAHKGVV